MWNPRCKCLSSYSTIRGVERSLYTGYLALFEERVHAVVLLRTMEWFDSGIQFYAGGGVYKDSVPLDEWMETEYKISALKELIHIDGPQIRRLHNGLLKLLSRWAFKALCFHRSSRNAPLIIAGTANADISFHTVLDERSAAFQAIGEALITQNPVAICCTSGSAVANYPGVLEAYYSQNTFSYNYRRQTCQIELGRGRPELCATRFFHPHIGASFELSQASSKSDFLQVM